jgi:transposase InsO family protein
VTPVDDPATRIALFRYALIAPLLAPDLEPGERSVLRAQILAREHLGPDQQAPRRVSTRTLQRWLKRYRDRGLAGLKPAPRKDSGSVKALDPQVLARAVQLREEVPARSTRQIIDILTLDRETAVDSGDISLSTLSRQLRRLGKTRALLRQPKDVFRRYEKDSPNAQWQSDVLYGPYLPDPANPGSYKRTYLIAFLDDHSRLVTHGGFYWAEDLPSLLDCFKRAILKRGLPVRVYCDRGVIYQSNQFQRICAELGIRHIAARPHAPEGKGKIERFWQTVESSFLIELQARPAEELEELQALFGAWLEQGYHHWVNRETGETPSARFGRSLASIRLPDPVRVQEAFLWTEERRVDKTACLTLQGNRYEVDPRLARHKVLLRYDPYDLACVQVWHQDRQYADAVPFELVRERDERIRPAPARPAELGRTGLSYLDLLRDKHEQEAGKVLARIPFSTLEDEPDV